jgi:DNA-binding transcriptional MerR regulator
MEHYGVGDVERLLRLSRATIRALVAAGFVSPTRGPGKGLRFSFQDLIVLRTAQGLAEANVPQRRITRAVRELRRHLPDRMPLSGLSISAVADQVVVREGRRRWQADSGQYLLEFEGNPAKGRLEVIQRDPTPASRGRKAQIEDEAQGWIVQAAAMEVDDPRSAVEAYQRAIEADPSRLDARINLGWLLHESRRFAKAEQVYREALEACGGDPLLLFNLGVLLDDLNRRTAAIEAYSAALRLDPSMADAHYNLALLYEKTGKAQDAIRHLAQYKRLA